MHLYWPGWPPTCGGRATSWGGCCRGPRTARSSPPATARPATTSPLLLSTTATRVDGGWRFTGHKIFGSLSPVWTYLGLHAMDTSDPTAPKIVHGFVHRTPGLRSWRPGTCWACGRPRATTPSSTAPSCPTSSSRGVPAGFAGAGPFLVPVFAWALLGFAGVYLGIAKRAYLTRLRVGVMNRAGIRLQHDVDHRVPGEGVLEDDAGLAGVPVHQRVDQRERVAGPGVTAADQDRLAGMSVGGGAPRSPSAARARAWPRGRTPTSGPAPGRSGCLRSTASGSASRTRRPAQRPKSTTRSTASHVRYSIATHSIRRALHRPGSTGESAAAPISHSGNVTQTTIGEHDDSGRDDQPPQRPDHRCGPSR